jgi:pimeloyl-ACP methyl ester carboxylesterase
MRRSPTTYPRGTAATVLLLHGALEDVSTWALVIAELQGQAMDVMAPGVPLRGLAGDAAYVGGIARQVDGPVLLVGHGYGGAVASVAAAAAENVVGLVYVAAFVLDVGESAVEAITAFRESRFAAALRPVEFRDAAGRAAIELYLRSDGYAEIYAADLPRPVAAAMAAAQRPVAATALEERAAAAAWRTLPSWYLVAAADRALDPTTQRAMAARAGAAVVEVGASHAVTLSDPAAVVGLIGVAATAVRGLRAV